MAWRLHPYRLPLARPYVWAGGTQTERVGGLLQVEGGWGEIAYPPGHPFDAPGVRATLASAFSASKDPAAAAGPPAWAAMADPRIRCAASTAAFDARAQANDTPLAAGVAPDRAHRSSVAVNGLIVGQDIPAQVAAFQAQGIRVLKVKCDDDRRGNVKRVAAVREAAPRAVIRLDANGSWSPDGSASHMAELHPFGIDYVEQPLPAGREDDMAKLAARAPFAIALDESATSARQIGTLIARGVGSVAILKPQRLGGPDRMLEAIIAAEDAGGRAVVTNSLETSIGVHAALHCAALLRRDEACGLATSSLLARDVASTPAIVEGRMDVPRRGLGVAPDASSLRHAAARAAGPEDA